MHDILVPVVEIAPETAARETVDSAVRETVDFAYADCASADCASVGCASADCASVGCASAGCASAGCASAGCASMQVPFPAWYSLTPVPLVAGNVEAPSDHCSRC